jgi:hypothetical protein
VAVGADAGVLSALLGNGTALGAPVGPPGGSVGSLMVGAVDGFGGKLMRTVSFLGWTLPVSFFTGGTAPVGAPGMFEGISAINIWWFKINGGWRLSIVFLETKTWTAESASLVAA